jgi:HAD superfamily hydrolase (TIGR01450 family)
MRIPAFLFRSVIALASGSSSSSSRAGRLSTSTSPTIHASFSDLISKYDAFILDQFGVMHNGVEALPGAIGCVTELHKAGKALIILSNTSAPSSKALEKLPRLGFDASHFVGAVTSGEEASRYIRQTYGASNNNNKPSKAIFFTWDSSDLNNPRLTALPEHFLEVCDGVEVASSVDEADFVLFHGSEVWCRSKDHQESLGSFITEGHFEVVDSILDQCIDRKLPAVCANPDFVVQTPSGGTAYMPGRIASRYEEMGGTCTTFGKPHVEHFQACIDRLGIDKSRVAHVGDSLHHDIAGAAAAGIPNILVTSGIHAKDLGTSFGDLPDRDSLESLFEEYDFVQPTHVVPAFRL